MADLYTNVYQGMETTPVNLYAQNYEAGARTAQYVPSTTSAIIEGALQGIQTGQKIESNANIIQGQELENQIRQNQVERLPQTNELQDLQIQAAKNRADIEALNAQKEIALQEDKIKADRAKLELDAQDFTQKRQISSQKDKFLADWKAADPLTKKQMLQNGDNLGILSEDPNLYAQSLREVGQYMTQDELDAATLSVNRASVIKDQQRRALLAQQQFAKTRQELLDSPELGRAAQTAGLDVEDLPFKIELPVAHGTYKTDPTGKIEIGSDGKRVQNQGVISTGSKRTYDLIYGDRVIASDVPEERLNLITKYKQNKWDTDGTTTQRRLQALEPPPKKDTGKSDLTAEEAKKAEEEIFGPDTSQFAPEAPAEIKTEQGFKGGAAAGMPISAGEKDTVPTPNTAAIAEAQTIKTRDSKGMINIAAGNVAAYGTVQKALGLSTEDFAPIMPKVKKVFQAIQAPSGRIRHYSLEQNNEIDSAETDIAHYTAGREYDTSKSLKNSYTEGMVNQHNLLVHEFEEAQRDPNSYKSQALFRELSAAGLTPVMMVRVETPRDLYVLKRSPFYANIMERLRNAFEENIKKTKQAVAMQGMKGSAAMTVLDRAGVQ